LNFVFLPSARLPFVLTQKEAKSQEASKSCPAEHSALSARARNASASEKAFVQLAGASNISITLRGILRSMEIILTPAPSKYPPFKFTKHGILMLSSVMKSEKADKV
jgi:hypothetical protein